MSSSEMETNTTNTEQPSVTSKNQPFGAYPMKWFKFLIYFALFCGALLNFDNGYGYITGDIYFSQSGGELTADAVYGLFGDGLKTLNMVYGIILIAMAGFGIYTRFRLAKFKENGPKCLYVMCAIDAALTIAYNISLLAVTGLNNLFSGSSFGGFVGQIVYLCINYSYFSKRYDLFVN